mmetsp:Transcript_21559/g.27905  ORF Transcript_21559/g.27905 Transcript_21559/m.27905 type:complete len:208 (-) Transcript_21559:1242-1865(-)
MVIFVSLLLPLRKSSPPSKSIVGKEFDDDRLKAGASSPKSKRSKRSPVLFEEGFCVTVAAEDNFFFFSFFGLFFLVSVVLGIIVSLTNSPDSFLRVTVVPALTRCSMVGMTSSSRNGVVISMAARSSIENGSFKIGVLFFDVLSFFVVGNAAPSGMRSEVSISALATLRFFLVPFFFFAGLRSASVRRTTGTSSTSTCAGSTEVSRR